MATLAHFTIVNYMNTVHLIDANDLKTRFLRINWPFLWLMLTKTSSVRITQRFHIMNKSHFVFFYFLEMRCNEIKLR